ncbi:MAG: hypothetical protein ACKVQK_27100 [Burkholderiales bacterium]
MARFGLKSLPLVIKGERAVNGQHLTELASLIGVVVDETPQLAPEDLIARTDAFMSACQRYARQFPANLLRQQLPYRDWDYLKLVHHVFFIAQVFVNQMRSVGAPVTAAYQMPVPAEMDSFEACAVYGDQMRALLREWWHSPDRIAFDRIFKARDGDRSAHQVLERACWHIGQHVRQVEHMLAENGIAPNGPLTAEILDRLPLPKNVWLDV